jgi:hypothetical protein
MEQLGSHWKDLYDILCMSIVGKSVEKVTFYLKFHKNNKYSRDSISTASVSAVYRGPKNSLKIKEINGS